MTIIWHVKDLTILCQDTSDVATDIGYHKGSGGRWSGKNKEIEMEKDKMSQR